MKYSKLFLYVSEQDIYSSSFDAKSIGFSIFTHVIGISHDHCKIPLNQHISVILARASAFAVSPSSGSQLSTMFVDGYFYSHFPFFLRRSCLNCNTYQQKVVCNSQYRRVNPIPDLVCHFGFWCCITDIKQVSLAPVCWYY